VQAIADARQLTDLDKAAAAAADMIVRAAPQARFPFVSLPSLEHSEYKPGADSFR